MGAMVPPLQWIPEDDVLLKSAVEAGASLESLAKGAVQFSRRYTVKELQDRWFSLLYDPITVMEASPHMFEVERSGFTNQSRLTKPETTKETTLSLVKRKSESIRKCYYAMRKRVCNEPFDMMGINNLISDPSTSNFGDGPSADCQINIPVSNDLGIEGPDFEFGPLVAGDLSFPYEDNNNLSLTGDQPKEFPLCNLFEPEGLENGPGPFRNFACSSSTMPQVPMWDASEDISVPIQIAEQEEQQARDAFINSEAHNNPNETEDYLAEISSTLFDDLIFVDNNGKETIDNVYYDGFSSLLLDSPSQADVAADVDLLADEHNKAADPQVKCFGPEYRNGVICCTLNTEDPEIPSNEDVFLPFRFPSPSDTPGGPHWRLEDSSYLGPSARKANVGPSTIKKKQKDSGSSQPSDNKGLKFPARDQVVKFELPKSNIQHAALRNGSSRSISSANVTANCYIGAGVKRGSTEMVDRGKNLDYEPVGKKNERGLDVTEGPEKNNVKVEVPNAEVSCRKTIEIQSMIDKSQLSDMEEWSENDVPYFSDVEAMILDMDLSPDESYTNPEVQRYQHEESKRTIIRLEQAADACMQRAISSRGAFAVLYGRCSKHFIKKTEVIIGRATEENKVDIDLGREKNGGKVSRRQAIIKMDMHGIFQMINVGKSSLHHLPEYDGQSSFKFHSGIYDPT
ncbi:microspherule protein 1 [Phtheirospermum japonicum]|uniref:Microspherule protein 1 n=1 Tax=Phtheirospermum japonicum TaxID=374723 RepID=A0A830CAA2_9LAMI|nr:microspherule protein 1 [Phtheirospermum japonicum]